MPKKENKNSEMKNEKMNAEGKKYLIQMIDVNADNGMTRVYSAICKRDFFNPDKNKNEQP